jgi:hypothetical protein
MTVTAIAPNRGRNKSANHPESPWRLRNRGCPHRHRRSTPRAEADIPTLPASRTLEGQLAVWCDHCERWHWHGGCDGTCTELRRTRIARRDPCHCPTALEGLVATHEHLWLVTLLIPLHQLILSSGAFLPPVAFDCLALPPACCVPDHGHCDVDEAEAELCCGHDVGFPVPATPKPQVFS